MAKGSRLERILSFYRSASPDEVRAALFLQAEILGERGITLTPQPRQRHNRRGRRLNGADRTDRITLTNTQHEQEITT